MATDLYEILEISKDATPQQIRKAYKRKALQTHPDRLPPGTSPEEKAASEELFRKINNAYEVLTDSQNRRLYDLHGVWPPPEPEPVPLSSSHPSHRPYPHRSYHASRNNFFSDPLFGNHPFFRFTDPFSLFDTVFEHSFRDVRPHFAQRRHHEQSWFDSQLSRMMQDDFDDPFMGFGGFGFMNMPSIEFPSFTDGGRRQWKSERIVTSNINGVTQTLHQRRDWDGNEHVTRTYADGREVRTVNGVEQPSSHGYLPRASQVETRRLPPPRQTHGSSRSMGPQSSYPPPPYPGHSSGAYNNPTSVVDRSRRHDRRISEPHPFNPDLVTSGRSDLDEGPSHKRSLWRSSRR